MHSMILSFDEWSINESTNNRILDKLKQNEGAIITAFRSEYSYKENVRRNLELLEKLKSNNYDVTELKGTYIENFRQKNAVEVLENSYLVVNNNGYPGFLDFIKDLGKKYGQDSVMFIENFVDGWNRGYLCGTKEGGYLGLGKIRTKGRLRVAFGSTRKIHSRKSGSLVFTFVKDEKYKENMDNRRFLNKLKKALSPFKTIK